MSRSTTLFTKKKKKKIILSSYQQQQPPPMEHKQQPLLLDPSKPPSLYLISAFFAMEPTPFLISLSKECGGGSITKPVQTLILNHCINKSVSRENGPSGLYVKNFLKKVIVYVEESSDEVLDDLYEQFAYYITSFKDDILAKGNTRVCKTFSFLFPDDCFELSSCPKSLKLEVPLRCSLNMLDGDTGCWIWPSSFYLSEFVLSYPEIFTGKSCLEVGCGVGLVGISLAKVKATKVILTDGDMSTLANLKLNLDLNHQLGAESEVAQGTDRDKNIVKGEYLSWEFASESVLQGFTPDIVLGADVIYDPLCFPHLVRVLSILLKPRKTPLHQGNKGCVDLPTHEAFVDKRIDDDTLNFDCITTSSDKKSSKYNGDHNGDKFCACEGRSAMTPIGISKKKPMAYITTVIRNVDTYRYFLNVASQAYLSVVDITENQKPLNLLPYMQSYDRSNIRLLTVSVLHN
ncbi:hypothetical protein IFM89_029246 [Coptis chinensis]|uniref:FAM86 N-terminal domain-containing protein n=1 Tax=Coptis chinensis TaxID=261450 RepID=A0A835LC12_9MAGN|nr:hypothetical protein IFM89_029246 [Coptis chinensis]